MKPQALYAGLGFTYAVIYGFWTMLITGGGHGNYVWFLLFCYVSLLGLYFPLMGALYADLKLKSARRVFLTLLFFHFAASSILLIGWVVGVADEFFYDGLAQTVELMGATSLALFATLHYMPSLVLAALYLRSNRYNWPI